MTTSLQKKATARNWYIFWAKGVIKIIESKVSTNKYIYNDEKYFILSLIKEFNKFITLVKENNTYDRQEKD